MSTLLTSKPLSLLGNRILLMTTSMAILASSICAPPPRYQSLSMTLNDPIVYKPGVQDDVVLNTYRKLLSRIVSDTIVFEGLALPKPQHVWTASALHTRAETALASVLFGECRGQDIQCMMWVGHVALNRANLNLDRRYGKGLWGVLNKHYAFSCLLKKDPNYKVIQKALNGQLKPHSADGIKWTIALGVAHQLMHRDLADPTHGAVLYHAIYIHPKWASSNRVTKVAVTDGHIFYKEQL